MAHFPNMGRIPTIYRPGSWEIFPGASPWTPLLFLLHSCLLSAPQYEFCSDRSANRKFFQAIAKFLEVFFRSISVFIMALLFFSFFAQIFGQSMHLRCSGVSCDHDHLSYGGLKVVILLCCFCRKSLRGVQLSDSTKNLGCTSAILSIRGKQEI